MKENKKGSQYSVALPLKKWELLLKILSESRGWLPESTGLKKAILQQLIVAKRRIKMAEYIVTPNLEHVPEREYVHDKKGNIICRDIISKKIIFELCLTKKQADILMDDLYYGEYTGA